jgi:protein-tyrosine kinase
MATVYEALQRGRQEQAPTAPPLPRVSKPHPARFGVEMRDLSGRIQSLFEDRKPVTLGITATDAGAGTSTVARELAHHLVGEGRTVLLCGDPADLDVVRIAGGETETRTRSLALTSCPGLTVVDIADLHRRDSGYAGKAAFRHWLSENSRNFDFVIIDIPPVLEQRSWSGFMGSADGIIMVVEAERTRSEVVKSTAAVIAEASGHVLGMVLNKRRQYIPRGLYKWL